MIKSKRSIIKNSMVGLVVLFLISYIVITIAFPTRTTDVFGFRTFIIVSPSMEPTLKVNDMIVITDVTENDINERDIITFQAYIPELSRYSYVTHYVASIETSTTGGTIYKTQGANLSEDDVDEWTDEDGNPVDITFDDIEGEYQFTIPLIGTIVHRLQDPIFVGLLVLNGTVFYFLYKAITNYITTHKNDEKKEIK